MVKKLVSVHDKDQGDYHSLFKDYQHDGDDVDFLAKMITIMSEWCLWHKPTPAIS